MTKLDELIELNCQEKQNRKNRLEDKLKQQEYYGAIEELFDPLTKNLNTNCEILQAHQTQTMEAIGENASRIGETAKQIQEAGSQIGETGLRIEDNTNAMKALSSPPFNKTGSLSESLSHYQVERASCLN